MGILTPDDVTGRACATCGAPVPPDVPHAAGGSWSRHEWTCRHGVAWTCPACRAAGRRPCCARCRGTEEYT